jgi:hypothetical protein
MNTPKKDKPVDKAANPDPITGAPGAHPLGTAAGAAAGGVALGATAGAIAGAAAGPIGAGIGAAAGIVAGAIGGGLTGKEMAEDVNPTIERDYWREHYTERPYVERGEAFDDYDPAYRTGWESQARDKSKTFDEVESDLERAWPAARGASRLEWQRARLAARDAWERARQRAARSKQSSGR